MQDLSDPTDLEQGTMSSSNKVDIFVIIIPSWYGIRYTVKQSWYLCNYLAHVTEVASWVSWGQYDHKRPNHSQESEVSEVEQVTSRCQMCIWESHCRTANLCNTLKLNVDLWVFSTATNNESRGQFVLGLDKCLTLGVLALHLPNA